MPQVRRIEVGSRLRGSRQALKLTQKDVVAELKGMGRALQDSTLSSYESGRRTIDAFTLADLCLIYGVSIDFVMFGTQMVPDELRKLFVRVGKGSATSQPEREP